MNQIIIFISLSPFRIIHTRESRHIEISYDITDIGIIIGSLNFFHYTAGNGTTDGREK